MANLYPKFRAWHKQFKLMKRVRKLDLDYGRVFVAIDSSKRQKTDLNRTPWNFNNITIMQWTGQQDKNGKDIYEGDIITLVYSGVVYTGSVEWDSSTASFRDCSFNSNYLEMEKDILDIEYYKHCIIIGNIYENPELLTISS